MRELYRFRFTGEIPDGKIAQRLFLAALNVVRPSLLAEVNEVWEGLDDGTLKYRFVGIDSLSELERLLQASRKHAKSKEFLSLREFGESAEIIRDLVRKFRDLRNRGISVIFTALEMVMDIQVTESETVTKAVPMLTKRFALEAAGLMDMVARLIVNPNTGQRELHFAGSQEFIAKTRVHCVNAVEPPDLTALFRKIYGIKAPAEGERAKTEEPAAEPAKPLKPGKKASENGKA